MSGSQKSEVHGLIDQSLLQRKSNMYLGAKVWYMISFLAAGIILAIGHDLFYRYLDGNEVNGIFSQTWVTNIGTAFAFLFKMFVAMATGIAFVQYQWRSMKRQNFKIESVDTMSAMLEDAFALLHTKLWVRVPVLVLIAGITWIIPIAAVFPPGTLNIQFLPHTSTSKEAVPQLALFNNTNWNTWAGTVATYGFSDAAPIVYRGALATATSGKVMSVPHLYSNESYTIQFHGPAIKCENTSSELLEMAHSHINLTGSGGAYYYISFVGGDDHQLFNTSGLSCSSSGFCGRPSVDTEVAFRTLDSTSEDAARLYTLLGFTGTSLTECKLYNASYEASFNFSGVEQEVTVAKLDYLNTVAANTTEVSCGQFGYISDDCLEYSKTVSYQSIMKAFGSLFVGTLFGKTNANSRVQTLVESTSIAINWTDYRVEEFQASMVELFSNITLSMLNFPEFRQNPSTAGTIDVNMISYPAVYEYKALKLWLAYGIGIGLATVCVVLGLFAIRSNESEYSNKFSTYVRVTKNLHLYELVDEQDDGANPCPGALGQSRMMKTRPAA